MSTKLMALMMAATMAATVAMAEFNPPSKDQIQQAAAQPAAITNLLVGANSEQAAQVGKAVIVAVIGLKLAPEAQDAAIMQVISGIGSQGASFGAAFGAACGGSQVLRSPVQAALAGAGGGNGAPGFGIAFAAAVAADKPPFATGYPNQ